MRGAFLSRLLPPAAVLLAAALGSAPAQDVARAGFASARLLSLSGPVRLGGFDFLPGGGLLLFRDNFLMRWNGKSMTRVRAFPAGSFGAFVRNTGKGIFVGESSSGGVFLLDPVTGRLSRAAAVRFPFDLAESPRGGVYLSANPGWGSGNSGTRIYLLDPGRGSLDEIVRLSGPSGPIAFDGAGNLYYAVQSSTYPTPPGAVRILRWAASRVAGAVGPGFLTEKDARVVWKGLDGAFGMTLDRWGRIYLTDPRKGLLLRLDPSTGGREILLAGPAYPKTGYSFLRMVEGKGPATFDPYQPARGGRILLCASDYLSFAAVAELRPARPRLSCAPAPVVPPGWTRFSLAGGPSASPGLLLLSPRGSPAEIPLFPGRRAPLFLGVLPHPWTIALPFRTGAGGGWTKALNYAGGGPILVYGQAFFTTPGSVFTSSLLVLRLL